MGTPTRMHPGFQAEATFVKRNDHLGRDMAYGGAEVYGMCWILFA